VDDGHGELFAAGDGHVEDETVDPTCDPSGSVDSITKASSDGPELQSNPEQPKHPSQPGKPI
jgi:hypothetical protein